MAQNFLTSLTITVGSSCVLDLTHLVSTKKLHLRFLMFTTISFGFLNFTVYGAGLISLLIGKQNQELGQLHDLINASGYNLIALKDASSMGYLKSHEGEVWRQYFASNPEALVEDFSVVIEKLLKSEPKHQVP